MKNNFWKGLAEFGKNILAHVNISYDGATGGLHIDIIPADQKSADPQAAIGGKPVIELLPDETQGESESGVVEAES